MTTRARICVITGGHPSTCPRMLKAADALGVSCDVRVVSARLSAWAAATDRELMRTRHWRWTEVDRTRASAPIAYLANGARFKSAVGLAAVCGVDVVPLPVAVRAFARLHDELVEAALEEPADFFYGGTSAGIAAAAAAAERAGTKFAVDLEDFHAGQLPSDHLVSQLARRIEAAFLPRAAVVTASSQPIADACAAEYDIQPLVVHNTFPLPAEAPQFDRRAPDGALSLYWFSQTIGPGRGLEDVVAALRDAAVPGSLHLRGRAIPQYVSAFRAEAARTAPRVEVCVHPPASPDAIVATCRAHDIGLAVEPGTSLNNRLCLTNKALTYPLAGLAVCLTATPGQQALADDLGPGAVVYAPGDTAALAAGLRRWADDPHALCAAKRASWQAARSRWHWEHPLERERLVSAIFETIGG